MNNMKTNEEESREPDYRDRPSTPGIMRNIFGIFMIVVYVGMGVLLFINFFRFDASMAWLRYVGGVMFILYGIWRAYRQAKGIDSNV